MQQVWRETMKSGDPGCCENCLLKETAKFLFDPEHYHVFQLDHFEDEEVLKELRAFLSKEKE
jgi:hypothetical protein